MPRVQFVNQSAQDQDSVSSNPARLLNLYPSPVADAPNARTQFLLKSVLGQDAKDDIGTAPVRAMGGADGKNWLVGDGKLFEVASDGTVTQRGGAIADDANTTINGNLTNVTVVAGNNYYLWDGSTISQPTTKTFTWSSVGDASSLDALDFATANKVDDNILRAVEFRGNLLLVCETSTEIWSIDPDAADTSDRFIYADVTNTGLKAFNLLVRFDDALFFIGNDNRAYLFGQGVVSNTSVETSFAQSTPTHCFYYEDEGQKFCVIRFSDRPAWVYDLTTGLWHERSEGAGHIQWRATASVRNGATWLVGNTDGEVLELARTNTDLNAPLYRRAISRTVFLGDRRFSISSVELLARMGDHDLTEAITYALAAEPGFALLAETGSPDDFALLAETQAAGPRDALVDMYESLDGGRTWRGPKTRSMGRNEDYEQRMVWRARGQARQYTMRFEVSEPADISLYSDGYVTAT